MLNMVTRGPKNLIDFVKLSLKRKLDSHVGLQFYNQISQ